MFAPTATYAGAAAFTYTLTDGHGGTSTATVDLGIGRHEVMGTANADTIRGTTSPGAIYGLAGTDTLYAGSGGDVLDGGAGNDILYGGAGADTFVFNNQFGSDTIYNFVAAGAAHDILQFDLAQVGSAAKLLANGHHQVGADTVFNIDGQNSVTLKNTLLGNLTLADINISTKVA